MNDFKIKKVTSWYVTKHPDTIESNLMRAPEARIIPSPSLAGTYNHKWLVTSPIKKIDGRSIVTRSGTLYILEGEPDPNFFTFLKSINEKYDSKNPLAFLIPNYVVADNDWNGFGGDFN